VKVLSLFSGGGGLDLAAEMLWPGLGHVAFVENDRHASSVLARHWPDVPNLGDVTAVDWRTLGQIDVVLAGFPCQDISHAGKRAGIKEGTRSGLWFRVADAIRVLRPRLVLLENVAAIASPGGGLDVVAGSLAEDGWDAEWCVLRASDVGACHGRARWFCVAYADGVGFQRSGASWAGGGRPAHGDMGSAADAVSLRCERRRGNGDLAGSSRAGEVDSRQRERDGYASDDRGPVATHADGGPGTDWGGYAPAIRRWERVLGRPAPAPTDARGRLNAPFVEWMLGWPEGHTSELSRSQALKVLGNGVVVLQAVEAYAQLLNRIDLMEVAA